LAVTDDSLSAALRQASALLGAAMRLPPGQVPPAELARLQRQFRAVCDAAKTPGADPAACRRRADALLAALDSLNDGKSGNNH
jgi:streptomycin 6-kinase